MSKLKSKLQILTLAIVTTLASSYTFANDLYLKTGASINSLVAYNSYGPNAKEFFPAFDVTGGINKGAYSYEIGYTQALPKNIGYDYYSHNKINMDFSNIHADVNRNIYSTNNLLFKAGIGMGVLNTKTFASKYDYKTASRAEASRSTQSLQARGNIGAQYKITKNFHTNLDIQGQGSSTNRPFLVGAGLNVNYKF